MQLRRVPQQPPEEAGMPHNIINVNHPKHRPSLQEAVFPEEEEQFVTSYPHTRCCWPALP